MATVAGNLPIIGEAPEFLAALERVSQVAGIAKPVLVIGERGTGKELIAARIHFLSPRWDQPLVKLNCSALTETLLESELFGHEAGAFTGATRRHIGRFERADQGTLILDELGTLPPRMQEKLLRVVEYGEFERVGGDETITVDVRLVGSTNDDLPRRAARGEFRADLLDRLAFDVITVPPLRAREPDIAVLAQHFAVNVTAELGRPFFAGFSDDAMAQMHTYPWPGNVRELKNAVERSVYRMDDHEEELDALIVNPFASAYPLAPLAPLEPEPASAREAPTPDAPPETLPGDLKAEVAELEIRRLRAAMRRARHHQKNAAGLLGLNYHQFRNLARKHGLAEEFSRRKRASSDRPSTDQNAGDMAPSDAR
ncbi:MAG: phage shock protein operon transcriptional activator [Pseudomonadota bacterium]